MNPIDAQAKLFDYIVCKEIAFSPVNPKNTGTYTPSGIAGGVGTYTTTSTASHFIAKMVFSRFFNHPDQVEVYSFFYPEGIKKSTPVPMDIQKPTKIYDKENGEALQIEFSIPNKFKNQIKFHSDVVFALRLHLDKSQELHFPYALNGKERYLGAKIEVKDLGSSIFVSDLNQQEKVTIAPLQELKTSKPW